jgi:hypothetical protein
MESDCTDSTLREPHSSPMETDISEPEMVDSTPVVASTPMEIGASEATLQSLRHKVLSTPKPMVTGPSDATLQSLREKVASSPMNDHFNRNSTDHIRGDTGMGHCESRGGGTSRI